MSVKALQRHQGDRALNAVQDNIEEHTKVLTDSPIVSGKIVKDISLPAYDVVVEVDHKLGRVPKGWVVTRRFQDQTTNFPDPVYEVKSYENKDKVLKIYTSGDAVTVDLWVF